MRSIAVINQKGGCGKTTTAINLSAFLAREPRRVLLVDMDPQGHSSIGLKTDFAQSVRTISDVLLRKADEGPRLSDVILPVLPNLDLVPADITLSAVPEKLSAVRGRERRLAEAIDDVRHRYHYVVVDCPPNVGLLTFNALLACSEAIIPIDPSFFSLHGIAKLLETLDVLSRETGHIITPKALITLYTGRSDFEKEVAEEVRTHMGNRVFETVIRFSFKLAEAASRGLPISECFKRCAGFEAYRMLAREILRQEAETPAIEKPDKAAGSVPEGRTAPSPPIPTEAGVIFSLDAPGAHRVQIAGDFNMWLPDGSEMEFSNGVWRKMLALSPGRYRYRYVVDGRWQADPMNSYVEPSPYGEYDSVIVLGKDQPGK